MIKEFKAFILKGSVVDLAVAVLIAGAFGKVISSFTNDILMPIIGFFTGGLDFSDMKIILKEASVVDGKEIAEVAIGYGLLINTIINLVLVGFALFVVVKAYNNTKAKEEEIAPAPAGPTQEELLIEIRDLLKK